MGDAATGLVESLYKGVKTRTELSVGAAFTVERDDVVTKITRISTTAFRVESYDLAA
jgi:hypothetical protein